MKLLIADDHTLFRDALVQYIERSDGDAKVTLAKDFYGALTALESDPHQDLIILDLRMPGMFGTKGFSKIRELYPDKPVALMSGVAESEDVREAIKMGAVGYFPKTLSGKSLLQAIHHVLEGNVFIPEDQAVGGKIMPSHYSDKPAAAKNGQENVHFTPREREVLSFLADGASNKEIARELNLQIVTVKLHVRGICRKLNVKNRTQAALMAREMGIRAANK